MSASAPVAPPPKQSKFSDAATPYFSVEGEPGSECVVLHDVGNLGRGAVSLRAIVRQLLSLGPVKSVPRDSIFNILGRLRALQLLLTSYNDGIDAKENGSAEFDLVWYENYVRRRTLDQLSAFGFQTDSPSTHLSVPGLKDLIALIEKIFAAEISSYKEIIGGNKIVFEALAELYVPGAAVSGVTGLGGTPACFRVVESYYDVKRTIMGFERSFHMTLEFVVSMGKHFVVVSFEEVMSGWQGVRTRMFSELSYVPLQSVDNDFYHRRGEAYARYGNAGASFLFYQPNSFFAHSVATGKSGGAASLISSAARMGSSGRIMVDTARGIQLGHHASQSSDEPTNAMIQISGRYRRWANDQRQTASAKSSETLILFDKLPLSMYKFTWPALVGFSFSTKSWGHVLVDGLGPIHFNSDAFDQLVLPSANKRLIRALVTFGSEQFDDIIAGKSGGSIFLLHGPPGVGKTLTAEAISEVLKRPLYYVTMGELGTTPDEMERRLGDVLDLCAEWDALTLIDEADVFLETRSTADVVRNAMVCVMLRLLEYHRGILFLTTNRIREFDPAFESRVTVALRYTHLEPDAREQVWRNLIGKIGIPVGDDVDYKKLARQQMNGRQIKNAVRLALALARDANTPLVQEWLDQSISITAHARDEMKNATNF